MRRRQFYFTSLAALALFIVVSVGPAYGQTYSVLYNFGSKSNDGSSPSYAGIIAQGRDGNLYTTTPVGGAIGNNGAVVKITPTGTETVLYSFDGPHGSGPGGGLTLGTDGNFYGTTYTSGSSCCGTIFKITPAGVLTVLYNFTGGSDGAHPNAPPIQGTDGNWYGTTTAGGTGFGTLYKLTASGTFTPLYQFDNTHGYQPQAPLVQGTDGSFYGTTLFGGAHGLGEVFKITAAGTLTVVYSFDGTVGQFPVSPLIQGLDGNFYGTTGSGGTADSGAVFKMTPAGVATQLHGVNGTNEGSDPQGGLVQASDGNLYGIDLAGPGASNGTFFEITTKGVFTVRHVFSGTDGSAPRVTPLQHTSGIIYGDTSSGGTGNVSPCTTGSCGVLYGVNSTLPAFIKLLPYSGKVGSKIGILGQGFSAGSVVKFNGVTATTVTLTGTTFLLATVPAGANDGFVTVTTGTTTLKSLKKFTVHNSWGSAAAMPTARQGGAVGVINGKIYVVGGATAGTIVGDNQIYNPTTNTWTTGAPMPSPRFVPASAVVNGTLYVFGGIGDTSQTPQATVQAYNPATNTWSTKAPMPTADDSMSAVVENGLIYVIGGYTGTRSPIVQRYNPATNTWASEASMLTGKSGSVLGLLGTTIISTGGLDNSGNPTGDTEGYNAATNKWSALKADATVRNGGCGGAISGQLYVTGGSTTGLSGNATTQTESFNLSKNSWTTLAPAPKAVINAMPAVVNNQLYCFGGTDDGRLFQGSVFSDGHSYQP